MYMLPIALGFIAHCLILGPHFCATWAPYFSAIASLRAIVVEELERPKGLANVHPILHLYDGQSVAAFLLASSS